MRQMNDNDKVASALLLQSIHDVQKWYHFTNETISNKLLKKSYML